MKVLLFFYLSLFNVECFAAPIMFDVGWFLDLFDPNKQAELRGESMEYCTYQDIFSGPILNHVVDYAKDVKRLHLKDNDFVDALEAGMSHRDTYDVVERSANVRFFTALQDTSNFTQRSRLKLSDGRTYELGTALRTFDRLAGVIKIDWISSLTAVERKMRVSVCGETFLVPDPLYGACEKYKGLVSEDCRFDKSGDDCAKTIVTLAMICGVGVPTITKAAKNCIER